MNQAADAYLSRVERDPGAPHYTDDSFRRKTINSNRRASKLPLPLGGKESNYLLQQEWEDVIGIANLTDRQLTVLALRLEGNTFEQIGRVDGKGHRRRRFRTRPS